MPLVLLFLAHEGIDLAEEWLNWKGKNMIYYAMSPRPIEGFRWLEPIPTQWGSQSIVETTVKALQEIHRHMMPTPYYLFLLSGTHIFLTTPEELQPCTQSSRYAYLKGASLLDCKQIQHMKLNDQEHTWLKSSCGRSKQWFGLTSADVALLLKAWEDELGPVSLLKRIQTQVFSLPLTLQNRAQLVREQQHKIKCLHEQNKQMREHQFGLVWSDAHFHRLRYEREEATRYLSHLQTTPSLALMMCPDEWFLQNLLHIVKRERNSSIAESTTAEVFSVAPLVDTFSPVTWTSLDQRIPTSRKPSDPGYNLAHFMSQAKSKCFLFFRKVKIMPQPAQEERKKACSS